MKSGSRVTRQLIAVLLILSATLVASRLTAVRKPDTLARPLDAIGREIAGFTGTDNPPLNDRVLERLGPSSYLSRTYRKQGLQADLFIAFYSQQRAGESMHSPKHCLPGAGWEIWDYGSTAIPVGSRNVTVNKYSISRDTERTLVLYWYQSKGRIIASEYVGKILLSRDALMQKSTAASIVRLIVPAQAGALEEARAFASELIPQLQECFGSQPG